MVISDIGVSGTRLSATVTWEENDRPKQSLWFESAAAPLTPSAEAYLVGCAMPALRDREKRVLVEGAVGPELLESMAEAIAWIVTAFGYDNPPPVLECARTNQTPRTAAGRRHAGMLSCGVDSLALIRLNHARYAETHPHRIGAGIAIGGFDCVTATQYAQLLERAHAIGQSAGIEVLDVATNLMEVAKWPNPTRPFVRFSTRQYEACILAACGHALSERISGISIGSTGVKPAVTLRRLHGTHPLLDPLYGSASMRVFHEHSTMMRLEKLRVVAEWDTALRNLMVCNQWERTELHCGRCGKCVRAILEFMALGQLDASPFRGRSVSAEDVLSTGVTHAIAASAWEDLVPPMMALGRDDLARAIRAIVADYRRNQRIEAMKERAKQADARYLGGMTVRANRFARRMLLPSRAASPRGDVRHDARS
jgi:hypothetical protein